jgi:hypothetical protein
MSASKELNQASSLSAPSTLQCTKLGHCFQTLLLDFFEPSKQSGFLDSFFFKCCIQFLEFDPKGCLVSLTFDLAFGLDRFNIR